MIKQGQGVDMKKILGIILMVLVIAVSVNARPTLMWNASTGQVDGYNVYHGNISGDFPVQTDVGNVTEYELEDLIDMGREGDQFFFIVRAYNVSGESGDSNQTDYIIPITTPNPPPGLTYTNGLLTWGDPEGNFDSFIIYYTTETGSGSIPVAGDQRSVPTPELTCGSTSTYQIVTVWHDVESPRSGAVDLLTLPCTPPDLRVIEED